MTDAISTLHSQLPNDCLFAPEQDMWVRLEADGTAILGATHPASAHGQFMLFTPRPVGSLVARDRSLGVMETAKTAVAIHAPLSCEIIATNEAVLADVTLIERDPYTAGWMFRVRPTALQAERAALLDPQSYAAWLAPRLQGRQVAPIEPDDDLGFDPSRGY